MEVYEVNLTNDSSVRPPHTQPLHSRWMPVLLFLASGAICFLTIDFAVARQFGHARFHNEFAELLEAAEHFGTPFGQVLILLVAAAFVNWQEPRVIRMFIGASAAGLSANGIKLLIARTRPRVFDFEHASLLEGFTALFPFGLGGYGVQSFPSAHTASAFGFAVMLTWAYPKARSAFLFLAFLVAMQRVCAGAHYPSDVCCGAAIGWLVASCFVGDTPLARWWDQFEMTIDERFNNVS